MDGVRGCVPGADTVSPSDPPRDQKGSEKEGDFESFLKSWECRQPEKLVEARPAG